MSSPARPSNPDLDHLIIVRTRSTLRARVENWRQAGLRIALVPTMGALHEGHLSLVKMAKANADKVIVSVFVNPLQFAPAEDLERYPRDEQGDMIKLNTVGADVMYVPDPEEMYTPNFSTSVRVDDISEGLCGAARPHFFGGVTTVVTKLLLQALPDIAVFGEKDYQQLCVIRRLVRDLDIPVEILAAPTMREHDGLAMSSRNAYLTDHGRQVAGQMNVALKTAASALATGEPVGRVADQGWQDLVDAGFDTIDYFEIRDAETLEPLGTGPLSGPARVFAAAWIDKTRLIDNWAV